MIPWTPSQFQYILLVGLRSTIVTPKLLHQSLYRINELHIKAWKPINEGPDIFLTRLKLFSYRTTPINFFDIQSYKFGCTLKKLKGTIAFVHERDVNGRGKQMDVSVCVWVREREREGWGIYIWGWGLGVVRWVGEWETVEEGGVSGRERHRGERVRERDRERC